jgi:signal transduction histidine kinase
MLRRWTTPAGGPEPRLLAVLLLTLGLTGVLAQQAQHAARSHRDAAEATLRDYAAFASWELGRRLEHGMISPLNAAMMHARITAEISLATGVATGSAGGHGAATLPLFRNALLQELELCRCAGAVHDFFVVDLATGRVARSDTRLPDRFDAWLAADLRVAAGRASASGVGGPPLPTQIRSVRTGGPGPAAAATSGEIVIRGVPTVVEAFSILEITEFAGSRVVYTVSRDPLGRFSGAYGFVLDADQYAAGIAGGVVERAELLPPSLTGERTNAEMLVVRVLSMDGTELYRTAPSPRADGVVVDTVESSLLRMATEVAVRPELAGSLLIGGLPRSRMPLLAVLFLITLVLVATGVVQLRRQQALARLRNDFVSGVSHELRTPLAQISMFAELLESGRLDESRRQRSIRIINEEAHRLRYLVENVLHFSGAGRNDRPVARVLTDVSALVRDVADGFTVLMSGRDATLCVNVESDLFATVDPHAVRQVLLNLLDNAVKYGPSAQRIELTAERVGDAILLAVEDEGPGIAEADREEVWKPYRRLPRDIESAAAGSGIGLAVVRELVACQGGTTHVEDAAGSGARFLVSLPIDAGGVASAPAPHRERFTRERV